MTEIHSNDAIAHARTDLKRMRSLMSCLVHKESVECNEVFGSNPEVES